MKSLLISILLCMTIKLRPVDVPQLFIVGDSTARRGDGIETWGWAFTDAHTHTSRSGAEVNAGIVADLLRQNSKTGMEQYLRVDPNHAQRTRFALNVSAVEPGSLLVGEADTYREERGFGYIGLEDGLSDQQCFAVAAEDANYRVEIEFGDAERASSTIIRAEGSRLMLEPVVTQAGEFVRRTIILNVRQPTLADLPKNAPGGQRVVMGNKEASGPTLRSEG
jgi:hypothetical protein